LIKRIFDADRAPLESIVKTTVYLKDASDVWIYEEIRERFLTSVGRDLPAAEFVVIRGPAPVPDAQVQIEVTAASP
jgi:enamine deaminase RidA (YjgF/YER057c/UK114 family)